MANIKAYVDAHKTDATDAHDASAVSFDDTGLGITAADVQTMGEQLDAAIAAGGIPATIFDAAGDIIVASAADTAARLAAGSEDDVLTIVSGVPAWAAGSGSTQAIGVLLHHSTTQNVTDAALAFDTEDFDPHGYHTGSGSSVTVPVGHGGVFTFKGGGYAQTGAFRYHLVVNATTVRAGPQESSNYNEMVFDLILDDADVVEMFGIAGAARDYGHASAVDAKTWFSLFRIGTV